MPNTLAHLGVQGFATKFVLKDVDPKWIYLGAVIPDIPWIFRRVLRFIMPGVDHYFVEIYFMICASFLFCLLLSLALAMLSINVKQTFSILALNSFLHLILDATQIKWANGIHLFAPLDWNLLRFDLYWPENYLAHLLTLIGVVFVIRYWRRSLEAPLNLSFKSVNRWADFLGILMIYFLWPLLLLNGPREADARFVTTLQDKPERPGKYVEFDRRPYVVDDSVGYVMSFAKENFELQNLSLSETNTISIRANFLTEKKLEVIEYHFHSNWARDGASYAGLLIVAFLWIWALLKQTKSENIIPGKK
jgi:hypothetical protein